MSKEGRPVERIDAKSAIRRNAELASDWAYHEEAIVLHNLAVRFRDELIDPLEHIARSRISDPIISFDDARNKEVLATYTVGRNALGLKDEITFEWIESDMESTTALERLNEAQKNDPVKTGTEEDTFVNSMMIARSCWKQRKGISSH